MILRCIVPDEGRGGKPVAEGIAGRVHILPKHSFGEVSVLSALGCPGHKARSVHKSGERGADCSSKRTFTIHSGGLSSAHKRTRRTGAVQDTFFHFLHYVTDREHKSA